MEISVSNAILVGYASRYGSTQEVAEALAAALRGHGLAVDLKALRDVRSLAGYGAVILGAPLYILRWHKEAHHFLKQHRERLAATPVAVFALGPFHDEAEEWQEVRSELDEELAKYPWLTPIDIKIVGGRFDPARLRFPWNCLPALKQMPASDNRDWAAIRAWADALVEQLAVRA